MPPEVAMLDRSGSVSGGLTRRTVAIVLHARVYRVGSSYHADMPNLLDLFLAMRRQRVRVVVCVPTTVAEVPPRWTEPLPAEIEVHELPYYRSNFDLIRRAPQLGLATLRRLLPAVRKWDVVGGVAPSGFGLLAVMLAVLSGRRGFFLVRGNVMATLRAEQQHSLARRLLLTGLMLPFELVARLLIRSGVPAFTFGPALAGLYRGPRVHVLRGYARRSIAGQEPPHPVHEPEQLNKLLYVGRLTGEKGIDILLRSLAALDRRGIAPTLTIVGDGADRDKLFALKSELCLDGRVTFIRYIREPEQLREMYLSVGTVVVPSRTEGLPSVVLEALSLGRVVVASGVGGIPSIIEDGKTGLLVPPEDPDALAAALARLAANPELAFRLARRGMIYGRSLDVDAEAREILSRVLAK